MANLITKFISKALLVCLGPRNKKLVMEKTLSDVKVYDHMHDNILPSKVAIVQWEIFVRVMKALDENHHSSNNVKLVTKHALLTPIVSAHSPSLVIDVAKAFGVHHKNINVVLSQQKLIDYNGTTLWSLFVRKKRTNGVLELLRKTILEWWTLEMHVSPNKSEVACKRVGAMVYDEKPTHFLMEIQICFNLMRSQPPFIDSNVSLR
jgi:hypothetical protein